MTLSIFSLSNSIHARCAVTRTLFVITSSFVQDHLILLLARGARMRYPHAKRGWDCTGSPHPLTCTGRGDEISSRKARVGSPHPLEGWDHFILEDDNILPTLPSIPRDYRRSRYHHHPSRRHGYKTDSHGIKCRLRLKRKVETTPTRLETTREAPTSVRRRRCWPALPLSLAL